MKLNFHQVGQGSPVIILHGLLGSLDNWQGIAKKLGERYQVFTIDLRNHGRSPHSAEFNYTVMQEDLLEFMTEHSLERVQVIGHSMGGKLAMHFALNYPEKVEKLVVVDMAPKAYEPRHDEIFAAMEGLELAQYKERGEIAEALAPRIPNLAMRQFLMKNIGRDEQGNFLWKVNLPGIHGNYDAIIGGIETPRQFARPTLFIRGGKSDYILEGDEALIRRNFPNARVKTLAQAGHWVQADAPVEFLRLVEQFLAESNG